VELRGCLSGGQCAELLARLAALPKDPPQADLLVFEGNCRLREATHRAKAFDACATSARASAPGTLRSIRRHGAVLRWDITWDDPARDDALALFDRALALEPERQDLVVGTIAARLEAGVRSRRSAFQRERAPADEPAADLYQVVQDRSRSAASTGIRLAGAMQPRRPPRPPRRPARVPPRSRDTTWPPPPPLSRRPLSGGR